MLPENELYGKIEGFKVDIDEVVRAFQEFIEPVPQTPYKDHGLSYGGWAITSDDGSISSGVKHGAERMRPMTVKTPLCKGIFDDIFEQMVRKGIAPYRARIMSLSNAEGVMKWHRDPNHPYGPYFRIQMAIITNPTCEFQWRQEGQITSFHIPADGHAYWVRTDVTHRAINVSEEPTERVHLMMGFKDRFLDIPKREIDYTKE